jgi:hypothetical protein
MFTSLPREFLSKTSDQISLEKVDRNIFEITTPYRFSDGDHFSIVLKKEGQKWILTDEGDTFMHLEVLGISESSLMVGTRHKILSAILEQFSVKDRDGELILEIEDDNYELAFYNFSQALIRISDLEYLSQERAKNTFLEDFKGLIYQSVDPSRCVFNWNDSLKDPVGKYSVDCKINSMEKPLMIFALSSEEKTLKSIITIYELEKWNIPFFPIGIFKDMESINSRIVSRFTNVCHKTYSNLEEEENRFRIVNYLKEMALSK